MKKIIGIMSGSLILIIFIWWIVNLNSLLFVGDFLFVTDKNKMNWIGLTGIIAIAGLLYNLYDGRRRFRGDIVSKSRIDWMKSIRPLIANYVTNVSNYMYFYHLHQKEVNVENKNKINKQLTEKMALIRSQYYQITLYIPKNDSNLLILKNVNLIYGELSNIGQYYDYGISKGYFFKSGQTPYEEVVDQYISDLFMKTIEDGSKYFKQEWETAKIGK